EFRRVLFRSIWIPSSWCGPWPAPAWWLRARASASPRAGCRSPRRRRPSASWPAPTRSSPARSSLPPPTPPRTKTTGWPAAWGCGSPAPPPLPRHDRAHPGRARGVTERVDAVPRPSPEDIRRWDVEHVWHPFTQMAEYAGSDPLVVVAGDGHDLVDDRGRRYFDGTSALWCNLFGHGVPEIDAAVRDQLGVLAHSTLLGATHPAAAELAR